MPWGDQSQDDRELARHKDDRHRSDDDCKKKKKRTHIFDIFG